MANIDKLFFLGSGASVCAGIPTFSTFKDKTEEIAESMDDTFKETLNIWRSARYKDYNIEEFYAAVEMDELCNNTNNVKTQNIVGLITSTIEKSSPDRKKILPYYYLANGHYPVITTNWDYILDSYGERLEKGWIDYCGINKHASPPELDTWDVTNPFKIFKLHGSLNWGACKEGHLFYFDKKDISDLKAGTAKCKICDRQLVQFIVPPTFSKLDKKSTTQNNFMSNIWHDASSLLSSCENLYFIGYSFPKTDAQMKFFIMNALQTNNNLRKVTVVTERRQKYGQNKVDFEDNYISVLSKFKKDVEIVFNYDGFECSKEENYYVPCYI